MDDLISVIVPIYNAEQYLCLCVNSLIGQSYKNLEIILVNDGSTDNCLAICEEYAKKDSRIKVINRINGGLSAARNTGIDVAQGDYITFIDSDDMIEPCMFEVLLKQLKDYDADISQCGVSCTCELQYAKVSIQELQVDSEVLDWHQSLIDLLDSGEKFTCSVWNKLYRKSMFDKMRFENVRSEDFVINYKILKEKLPKIVTNKLPLYHYIKRTFSITTGKLHISNFMFLDMLDEMESNETDRELLAHWKIQKAVSARNILIRQIISGDYSEYVPRLRRNMSKAIFIIIKPEYRHISRSLKLHILLQTVAFSIYKKYIKRASKEKVKK